mmetsp:Transcript_65212/g.147087  ORF Transcript_65212/g.147087 Transcript_65212/m.147087 type:complete len:496 (-) Transcript_65212:120-1607(-)
MASDARMLEQISGEALGNPPVVAPPQRQKQLSSRCACTLLVLHTVVCTALLASAYVQLRTQRTKKLQVELHRISQRNEYLHSIYEQLVRDADKVPRDVGPSLSKKAEHLEDENKQLRLSLLHKLHGSNKHPYKAITALNGHELPILYNQVQERTIWSYWYHAASCPRSTRCTLPAAIQLCIDSVRRNRGTFEHRIVHFDEVEKYVNWIELPVRWKQLDLGQQKDALMNALLARYGGVALDINSILLRPLDKHWEDMVVRGATFSGYMYRANGKPWRHPESVAVWFLMSRREGIFSTAVRDQVIGMGDMHTTGAYRLAFKALGDQTILPILSIFNYSLPKCSDDRTVISGNRPGQHLCPEYEMPKWFQGITGPARDDTRILLRDPRDGPHLPFALLGMVDWDIMDDQTPLRHWSHDTALGAPMHNVNCSSQKRCWEEVVLQRYNAASAPGEAGLMDFVTFFDLSKVLGRSRKQILSTKRTYFYNFLKLAGVVPGYG